MTKKGTPPYFHAHTTLFNEIIIHDEIQVRDVNAEK